MAFTIHAIKDICIVQTLRISASAAAEKARTLQDQGWEVYVTDQAGRRYCIKARNGLELLDPQDTSYQITTI